MKPKAIIVSGYFNPIHKVHIEYFNNAKAQGDKLIVIVNNDCQRALKASNEFQKEDERVLIVSNIKNVNQNNKSIPKVPLCMNLGIELIYGLGDKIQSSSELKNQL
jgi:cytidyltransferase-like protein